VTPRDTAYEGPVLGVVGWDAGTFPCLAPMLAKGELPNLARLIANGSHAELSSTVPPMTPVGWSSILTGCNPGKHGIYNWWYTGPGYELVPYTADSVQAPSLFSMLCSAGYRVGAINVPMAGATGVDDGFVLGGLAGPGFRHHPWSNSVHPHTLTAELEKEFPELLSEDDAAFRTATSERELLGLWEAHERTRRRAIEYLVRTRRPDVLWVHCHAGDYFGHRIGPSSPLMAAAFRMIDDTIGAVADLCTKEAHLVVLSDHGQTDIHKFVLIQNWLERAGLLNFKADIPRENFGRAILAAITRGAVEVPPEDLEETVLLLAGAFYQLPESVRAQIALRLNDLVPGALKAHTNIDWARTKAFCPSFYGHIYVNLQGRQPQGIVEASDYDRLVDEIIAGLHTLSDPATGLPVGITATARAKVYHGPAVEQAPDIVCSLRDPSYYLCPIYSLHVGETELVVPIDHAAMARSFRFTDLNYRGDHTGSGIFVISGPKANKRGRRPAIAAEDVAPMLLNLLGVEIPAHMDGTLQWDLGECAGGEGQLSDGAPPMAEATDEERHRLIEDLRRLGYRI
jgi:predicted AlkP superfamily phosphohydrolase/phosphomutase